MTTAPAVEKARTLAIWAGGLLWMTISTFPLLGQGAKREVACRGRVFAGGFDECFNDYLPLLEFLAPAVALALLWPFLRFASSVWKDGAGPLSQGLAVMGTCWCIWRASTYPIDRVTIPYILVWVLFGMWFAAGELWGPKSDATN